MRSDSSPWLIVGHFAVRVNVEFPRSRPQVMQIEVGVAALEQVERQAIIS
jgi:hypothetical protein